MIHYIFLTFFTTIIVFLTWKIWRKTKQIAFPIGIGFIFYWSLLGSWFFVYDQLTGDKGKDFGLHYYDINNKLFSIHSDNTYLLVISLYALFIIVIQMMILLFAKWKAPLQVTRIMPMQINHQLLIFICVLSSVLSFILVWEEILIASKYGESIYVITRHKPVELFKIHQLLNIASIFSLWVGFIIFICGKKGKYFVGDGNNILLIAYLMALSGVEMYLFFLGNKREILCAGMMGLIFYTCNSDIKLPGKTTSLLLLVIIGLPLLFSDGIRSLSPAFIKEYFDVSALEFQPESKTTYTEFTLKNTSAGFLFSNEMFYSHFSMYGVLSHDVPVTYGSSIVSLAASLVPGDLWPDRWETIYDYYFEQVHAKPGQGYTIHHATGWYLNFGIMGILSGAFIFGYIWVWLYNKYLNNIYMKSHFLKVLFILGISSFTAQIPTLIRNGPEGYKSLVLEAIMLPSFIIYITILFRLRKTS